MPRSKTAPQPGLRFPTPRLALSEDSIARSTEGGARLDEVAAAIRSITGSSTQVNTLVDK